MVHTSGKADSITYTSRWKTWHKVTNVYNTRVNLLVSLDDNTDCYQFFARNEVQAKHQELNDLQKLYLPTTIQHVTQFHRQTSPVQTNISHGKTICPTLTAWVSSFLTAHQHINGYTVPWSCTEIIRDVIGSNK